MHKILLSRFKLGLFMALGLQTAAFAYPVGDRVVQSAITLDTVTSVSVVREGGKDFLTIFGTGMVQAWSGPRDSKGQIVGGRFRERPEIYFSHSIEVHMLLGSVPEAETIRNCKVLAEQSLGSSKALVMDFLGNATLSMSPVVLGRDEMGHDLVGVLANFYKAYNFPLNYVPSLMSCSLAAKPQ